MADQPAPVIAEPPARASGSALDAVAQARRIVLRIIGTFDVGASPVRAYLFGSRARGDAGRASDIDIALMADEPLPAAMLARLREALEDSNIPYPAEVIDLATVDDCFRRAVLAEAIPWNG